MVFESEPLVRRPVFFVLPYVCALFYTRIIYYISWKKCLINITNWHIFVEKKEYIIINNLTKIIMYCIAISIRPEISLWNLWNFVVFCILFFSFSFSQKYWTRKLSNSIFCQSFVIDFVFNCGIYLRKRVCVWMNWW